MSRDQLDRLSDLDLKDRAEFVRSDIRTLHESRYLKEGNGFWVDYFAKEAYDQVIDYRWTEYGDFGGALRILEESTSLAATTRGYHPRRLPGDGVVVEYAQTRDHLLIWVFDRNGSHCLERRVPSRWLDHKVIQFAEAIKKGWDEAEIRSLGSQLYNILIPSLFSDLHQDRVIYFVPDMSLRVLPFAALWNERTGHYLVEEHPVAISPSLTQLQSLARRAAAIPLKSALLVGNPAFDRTLLQGLPNLPDAEAEIAAAGDSFERVEVLNGERATRCEILNQLDRFEVFGFAGHTVDDPSRPTQPCLLVAPTQMPTDIGLLSGSDVQAKRFHHLQLVVLSSCSSIATRATRVEGWTGIAKRFLDSGVPNVVGTLWSVNDKESASLLPAFYQAIAQGKPPILALRDMQVAAIHNTSPERKAPRVWSSYEILVGHGAAAN